ncbi:hypothetical protein MSG28_014993 [Choristoneura fumiferana]|uniref:Uncharacterized protein n=1 Tax=Choristoneura fumiferana TaxID=7141 RepID=A0ACC0KZ43_CHOFU|nr:hypothetical protein MSG28_014993 [Choristoneura fumiferana]
MSSYYTPLQRGLKWFRKVMMELLFGTALVNSWVVFNMQREIKMPKKIFLESVIEGFTKNPHPMAVSNSRTATLTKNHAFEKNGDKRRKCAGCYENLRTTLSSREANKKVKKIKSYCRDCNKPQCLKCFYNTWRRNLDPIQDGRLSPPCCLPSVARARTTWRRNLDPIQDGRLSPPCCLPSVGARHKCWAEQNLEIEAERQAEDRKLCT